MIRMFWMLVAFVLCSVVSTPVQAQGIEVSAVPYLPDHDGLEIYTQIGAGPVSSTGLTDDRAIFLPHAARSELGGKYDEICVYVFGGGAPDSELTIKAWFTNDSSQPTTTVLSGTVPNDASGKQCLNTADATWSVGVGDYRDSGDRLVTPLLEFFWISIEKSENGGTNKLASIPSSYARALGSSPNVFGVPLHSLYVLSGELTDPIDPTKLHANTSSAVILVGLHPWRPTP